MWLHQHTQLVYAKNVSSKLAVLYAYLFEVPVLNLNRKKISLERDRSQRVR